MQRWHESLLVAMPGMHERKSAAALGLRNRRQVEHLIEGLIDWLDALDGDCDLEEDDPAEDNHDAENDLI